MGTQLLICLAIATIITVNSDLERAYDAVSSFFFGGKKLTPKEF